MHDPLLDDVRRFSNDPDADELAAALLVNRVLDDNLDPNALKRRVQCIVDDCPNAEQPWVYLAELGFAGNQASYDSVENSRLDWLLEQRRGIPISLGVLLIHVARGLGLSAIGINFPGHFLVRVGAQLVDPFRMIETSEQQCLADLGAGIGLAATADVFSEASPLTVLLRMLNNLKYQFARRGEWHRSLDMIDLQLAVETENPHLLIERGEMWWRLGAIGSARESLRLAISVARGRNEEVVRLAEQWLDQLGSDEGTVH
ncbi:MAG: transglutaminase-like domain-containing protein [Gammaproteobacteria bacterium]|nr:transglutaminase-like domain-containing protein [Gammaproteobacteria bacterium]